MTSSKRKVEVHEQFPSTTSQCAIEAGSVHIENATFVDVKKVANEGNMWMQAESPTATTELQTAGQMRRKKMRGGSAIEAVAKALMKRTENEMKISARGNNTCKVNEEFGTVAVGNGSGRNKRKTNYIRRIIQNDIEQSGSKTENTVQLFFHETEEEPVDLSNRNGQGNLLDKQPDQVISGEQHCKERSRKRNASSSVKRKRTESKSTNYDNRPFSTFTPAEQKKLWHNSSFIYEGSTFSSYEQFQECFEAYKRTGNYPYRTASSEILRDGEGRMIDRFKYKYVVFHCAHYGIPRRRGIGQRPNRSYLSLGCKARFRLNADTTNGCLRISSFHGEHNHDNTEEDYLRVINKRRRNVTGETTLGYEYIGETAPDVNEHTNAREVTENNFAPFILTSENHLTIANSSQENSTLVVSSSGNSALHVSSQENSTFVPVTRSAEMTEQDDEIQQMSQQNLLPIGSVLRQIFAAQLLDRFQRIEYLIMNAYIINCGRCLPQKVYLPFVFGVYGADYRLLEWSDVQLRDVMIVLLQPPEILLQGKLPNDISINEVKWVRPPRIQRAIAAIREEKLKRCDKIFAPLVQDIFNATSRHDFLMAVREFKKFVDDVRNMSVDNIN
ncbi:hypothetical protein LOAG_12323 [Loa loa]|uniref:ZSWIM3 N-terminal domain-containing protein n=1 Tax=Loa loa TaxID=7209 RepID=A0A1S0TLC1_LOALO|nr:hypothetical protein LOAG_12323 [Loa loa]EFO16184.1 hypothetical protein LOAG_12323 [Loa loa]